MMKVLTADLPAASFQEKQWAFADKREAAVNLAMIKPVQVVEKNVKPDLFGDLPPTTVKQNPVVAKFTDPTVAKAIVNAMKGELALHDFLHPDEDADKVRRAIEVVYVAALVELADKRIAGELTNAAASAKSLRTRLQWSEAAYYLGDTKPFAALVEEFRVGKIKASGRDLKAFIVCFLNASTLQADAALAALGDDRHPLHNMAAHHVLSSNPAKLEDQVWFAHPFCLQILRSAVNDSSFTGATFTVEKARIIRREQKSVSVVVMPAFLTDPAVRRPKALERFCDAAAEKLADLVIGVPRYHPLLKDSEVRLSTIKTTLDRFAGNFRQVNARERNILGLPGWSAAYLPDIQPLDRPATVEDVTAGKAIFHMGGTGKRAEMVLPAVGILTSEAKSVKSPNLLIVQAEIGLGGELSLGIITRDDIRRVSASEVTGVKSFEALEKEAIDAALPQKDKSR